MSKKETIWRHILTEAFEKRRYTFTQKDLAAHFAFSTSTIFNALKAPRGMGAIEVTGRFFRLIDAEKLLLLWATHRNMKKDIIYRTHSDAPARKIEGEIPPDITFGAFSAYRLKYNETPADYSLVYVYAEDADSVKKRFPPQKGYQNIFVLKSDPFLEQYGKITPDVQTFVDLWNITEWYAKDFREALKSKLFHS